MALRDKVAARALPHLEPGEELRQVFMAQTGPSPYWILLTWFTLFWNKYLIVAVTDRNIVTFRATAFKPSFVKKPPQIERLDRNQLLGPCSGIWAKTEFGGETFNVHKRFHKDIASADAELAQRGGGVSAATPAVVNLETPIPAGWFPDPQSVAEQRYWDGQAWTDHTA